MKTSVKWIIAIAALVGLGLAAYWFQPWRLFTNVEVVEALPTFSEAETEPSTEQKPEATDNNSGTEGVSEDGAEAQGEAATQTEAEPTETQMAADPEPVQQAGPVVLFQGELISHEYETTGTVQILSLPDGTRILRLEGLETSDGPDLEVWLSDADVVPGRAGWFLFDDGDYASLGKLKGNLGDQNYEIPAALDLERFSSMSIWCVRFAVSFGAAELAQS